MPALVAKAEAPTKGAWRFGARFRISSSARETWVSSPSPSSSTPMSKRSAKAGFSFKRADQGHEIGVAATLAEPVQRALDLACAGIDRRQ